MALKKFIGARYAPEFAGSWSNTKQYAALSVVYADNRSYVSRKTVPAGTPITNTEFWIQSSDWNAQVAEYNLKVEGYNANVEQYNRNVQDYSAAVSGFYADTLHSFDTKADMQADRTLALGETLLTCGDKKIGDGGGSFYQVVSKTSVTAVALDNGLFAEPFEFQPYESFHVYTANNTETYETPAHIGSVIINSSSKAKVYIDVSKIDYNDVYIVAVGGRLNSIFYFKLDATHSPQTINIDKNVGFITFYKQKNAFAGFSDLIIVQKFFKPTNGTPVQNIPITGSNDMPIYGENFSVVINNNTTLTFNDFLADTSKTIFIKNTGNSEAIVTFKSNSPAATGSVSVEGNSSCIAVVSNYTGEATTNYLAVSKFVSSEQANVGDYVNYNGTRVNPTIIGMIKGSTTAITIPLKIGETKTAFASAVYNNETTTNKIKINVTGDNAASQTYTFTDTSASTDSIKTVVYGITVANINGTVRLGASAVTSYISQMTDYIADYKVGVPNESNTQWGNDTNVSTARAKFHVNETTILKGFTVNAKVVESEGSTVANNIVFIADSESATSSTSLWRSGDVSNIGNQINQTFFPNITLDANKDYWICVQGAGYNVEVYQPATVNGTYGPFVFDNSRYSGILYYNLTE